ncbi:MAG: hypothetical protein EHM36_07495 [Deltaproteobacteria bacterium]|nr:MAG: hypothetical protein EHM36_07495 [Deltaproteobacteria bacterium]
MMTEEEFQKWKQEVVAVLLTKVEILSLVGHIQLALRHPENKGPTREIARHAARRLASLIAHDDMFVPEVLEEWRKEGLI